MKKTVVLALSIVLVFVSLSCFAQAGEWPAFITIRDWLDARGECGDCMLLLKVIRILNPVLAAAADDTGTINLFSGNGEDSMIINFMSDECPQEGAIPVIANPKYHEFEGSAETAEWTVLRVMRDPAVSDQEQTIIQRRRRHEKNVPQNLSEKFRRFSRGAGARRNRSRPGRRRRGGGV